MRFKYNHRNNNNFCAIIKYKDDQKMSYKCINYKCISKIEVKLMRAPPIVCTYYHVSYKPYQRVCGICLEKCILHYNRLGKKFKNQECIFSNIFPKRHEFNESSDEEEHGKVNVSWSTATETSPQEIELSNYTKTVLKSMEPLINLQKQKCEHFLISKAQQLAADEQHINNLVKKVDNNITKLFQEVYKYNKLQLKSEESDIVNKNDHERTLDNDVIFVLHNKLSRPPKDVPQEGLLRRRVLKPGDMVYALKFSLFQPWFEATVQISVSDTYFNILFDEDGEKKTLSYTNLAYSHGSNKQYKLGCRVIAKFKDVNIKMTDKFYVGVIAEQPKYLNNFRYLIFFDSGYTQYLYHKDIRLVCHQSIDVSDDVHENNKEFVKAYLDAYPECALVKFNKKQLVRTELDNNWYTAKVVNLDASLVQLKFIDLDYKRTEWIYRGSNRLGTILNEITKSSLDKRMPRCSALANVNKQFNRPDIELQYTKDAEISMNIDNHISEEIVADNQVNKSPLKQPMGQTIFGIIEITNIPSSCPQPLSYITHQCNHFCMLWIKYDVNETKSMNTLSIPLHFGFKRSIIENDNSETKVIYTTPCGYTINNENEMYNYLKKTAYNENQMTIDLFNFDLCVNPLARFKTINCVNYIDDTTNEMEFKPISLVNCFNYSMPQDMKYITHRKIMPGVILNLDTNFLCNCECTDDCEDKTKCSCWQLTYESQKHFPLIFKDSIIGYNYKRLYEPVYTGIYECNANCKCLKTCLNRVVQQPLSTSLQLFLTKKKGWGVRTLADIPRGSYICTYVGELYTEHDAEKDGMKYGDEYLAELDFIETSERIKEGYESNTELSFETESENDSSSSSDDEEEEFNPGIAIKSKIKMFESRMSLRKKNIQNTNTKVDGNNQLSKLNSKQTVKTQHKSLRDYFDDHGSVYILDAKISGNIGRYFNHSCDPNIFVQNVFVDTHDLRFPWVTYFASTYIPAGTELTWNYSYEVGSVKDKVLKCYCESKNCKGRLL